MEMDFNDWKYDYYDMFKIDLIVWKLKNDEVRNSENPSLKQT